MAVFLNTPEDFTKEKPPAPASKSMNKLELLPPSAFEKPAAGVEDPWKALGKATNEILELRKELDEIRRQKQITLPAGEEIRARVDVHHSPHRESPVHSLAQDVGHYSDLINRQASEIADLRKALASADRNHQMALAKLESQVLVKDAQYEQQREAMEMEIESCRKHNAQELQSIVNNYERDINDQAAKIEKLQRELDTKGQGHQLKVSDLQKALKEADSQVRQLQNALDSEKSSKSQLIEEQNKQINQLKKYISETEEGSRSSEVWRRDLESLRLKVKRLEREREEVLSTNQLLNVRINSFDKILTLQEQALAKNNQIDTGRNGNVLLTRWRQKVYQLMVQLKSLEIYQKQAEHNWSIAFAELGDKLQHTEAECDMLRHSLENKDAELAMMSNRVKVCEEEVLQAQDVALRIDENLQEDKDTGRVLASFAHRTYEQYQKLEDMVSSVMTSLTGYNHRISFATGRVQLLESQLVRKKAISKLQTKEDIPQEIPTRDTETEVHDDNLIKSLQWEVDKVTKERDRLAGIIKQDAQLLEQKISAAKQQYADEVLELKYRLKELHEELEKKTEEAELLAINLDTKEKALEKAKEDVVDLRSHLEENAADLEKEMSQQLIKESEAHEEKIRELEEKLNAAKREQAKAVVALTQAERQQEREKKKALERAEVIEMQLRSEIERLEEKLRSVQAERNLLMTTIRQEGLLSKVQSQRGYPSVPDYLNEEPTKDFEDLAQREKSAVSVSTTDEPLHAVIDDLRLLTAVVMEDSNSPEDDD